MRRLQQAGGAGGVLFGGLNVIATILFILSVVAFGLKPPVAGKAAQSYDYVQAMLPVFLPLALLLSAAGILALLFVRALDERLRPASATLSSIAALYGYVGLVILQLDFMSLFYMQQTIVAGTARKSVEELFPALFLLDSVADLVGSLFLAVWIVMVSSIALRRGGLPRGVNYLGFLGAVVLVIAELLKLPAPSLLVSIWLVWMGALVWLRPPLVGTGPGQPDPRV